MKQNTKNNQAKKAQKDIKFTFLRSKAELLKLKAEETKDPLTKRLLLAKSNLTFLQLAQIEDLHKTLPSPEPATNDISEQGNNEQHQDHEILYNLLVLQVYNQKPQDDKHSHLRQYAISLKLYTFQCSFVLPPLICKFFKLDEKRISKEVTHL